VLPEQSRSSTGTRSRAPRSPLRARSDGQAPFGLPRAHRGDRARGRRSRPDMLRRQAHTRTIPRLQLEPRPRREGRTHRGHEQDRLSSAGGLPVPRCGLRRAGGRRGTNAHRARRRSGSPCGASARTRQRSPRPSRRPSRLRSGGLRHEARCLRRPECVLGGPRRSRAGSTRPPFPAPSRGAAVHRGGERLLHQGRRRH